LVLSKRGWVGRKERTETKGFVVRVMEDSEGTRSVKKIKEFTNVGGGGGESN